MRARLKPEEQMTIEEFLAFTAERPDDERWELIEGVAVLNASPSQFHQIIVTNIASFLVRCRRERSASWTPLLGVGTRVPASPRSLPQPDVMVLEDRPQDKPTTDEAIVLFEVLSRSNTKADQAWRRKVYVSIPNLQHYVTVAQSTPLVERFDRASGWSRHRIDELGGVLEMTALAVRLPLAEIYADTPHAPAKPRKSRP